MSQEQLPGSVRARRRLPLGPAFLAALVLFVVLVTNTGSIRTWWAHRVHDLTGGGSIADFVIGLAVALLPLAGVALGRLGTRGPRRVFRMVTYGALGFVVTFLLAPSPLRYLVDRSQTEATFHAVPGYLPGVLTGILVWVALGIGGYLLARSRWRRFVDRITGTGPMRPGPARFGDDGEPPPRVIDV